MKNKRINKLIFLFFDAVDPDANGEQFDRIPRDPHQSLLFKCTLNLPTLAGNLRSRKTLYTKATNNFLKVTDNPLAVRHLVPHNLDSSHRVQHLTKLTT